jgi:MATE family multidrug resistance protein
MHITLRTALIILVLCLNGAGAYASGILEDTESLLSPVQSLNPDETITELVPLKTTIIDSLGFYSIYIASQLAKTINGILNGYLYGKIGGPALSSEAVTLTYEFLIMGTAMGALRASSILVGQIHQKDRSHDSAKGNIYKTAFVLTTAYSTGAMVLLWQGHNVIGGIGLVSDPQILEQIQGYFFGFMWGVAPTLLLFSDEQFSLGLQDPKVAGIFGTFYAATSSLLAYPLALGAWGMPNCGVTGIGYAMSAGPWASWLLLRGYYKFSKDERYKDLNFTNLKTLRWQGFKTYLSYGVPLGLTNSLGLITSFFSSQFITGFSNTAATAYSAASSYFTQLEIILLGCSAISAKIANFDPRKIVGEGSHNAQQNVKRYIMVSVASSVGLAALCSAPALIWQDEFIYFFAGNQTEAVLELSKKYLWFVAGQEVVNTYSNAAEAAVHGLKDIAIPFCIDLLSDGINLSSVVLVSKYAQDPMWLVGASTVVCVATAVVYSTRMYSVVKGLAKQGVETVSGVSNFFTRAKNKISSWFESDGSIEDSFA